MALDPKTKETVREEALRLSKEFAALDGRRPRVLLIEMENDLKVIVKNENLPPMHWQTPAGTSTSALAATGGCGQRGSRQRC